MILIPSSSSLAKRFHLLGVAVMMVPIVLDLNPLHAQMVSGDQMKNFGQVFSLKGVSAGYTVSEIKSSCDGNIFFPGEQPTFTFVIHNKTNEAIQRDARVDVIAYGTKGDAGDIWLPDMIKLEDEKAVPFVCNVPANGSQEIEITPSFPARFGAYALVFDLGTAGRKFGASCVRTFAPQPSDNPYPVMSLDEAVGIPVLRQLGLHSVRYGFNYTPSGTSGYEQTLKDLDAKMADLKKNGITAMVTFLGGGDQIAQPLGMPRPQLDKDGVMLTKASSHDYAWLPKYDPDFSRLIATICKKYGYPKGPITAVELWNEPWEGASVSGWGADSLRFREIYTAMAQGVESARADGENVLLAGCDSSSNTLDKLFPDGDDKFLKWLDVCAIHYQGATAPTVYRKWLNRKALNGRVKIWDTESWVANTDDRVAAVVAGDRAFGYDRTMGVFYGNVSWVNDRDVIMPDGQKQHVTSYDAWSTAAAMGAATHFLGDRSFNQLLFKNGLPWVLVFDGLNHQAEDGTVVVIGDLGAEFDHNLMLFRGVHGLAQADRDAKLRAELAAAVPDSAEYTQLTGQLTANADLRDASLTLANPKGEFQLFDFYGNAVPANGDSITVPLDSRGFFLRTTGQPGSFQRLKDALAVARIDGYQPVDLVAHDLLAQVGSGVPLHLTVTNILNRPVTGQLHVALADFSLTDPGLVSLQPHETRDLALMIQKGAARDDNTYPLSVRFDASADGAATLNENLHVNVIAKRQITIDGKLDDWKGIPPQPVTAGDQGPTLMETAWQPFAKFDPSLKGGAADGYLAYDDHYFYFAAKILDDSPSPGTLRFATRDPDEDFYPEVSKEGSPAVAHRWPDGVRRYSYRQNPVLPFGSFPAFDNVQIAFNVIPPDQKADMLPFPPGTMPGFLPVEDTDFEYALNSVDAAHGGGTEIWRCLIPGMPRKHFYPREPASPFDGAVTGGKLIVKQDGNTRIVEAALPWKEIPQVRQALEAGNTIKFTFRVNNGTGPSMELAEGRSVSRQNSYTFHPDWVRHWSNQIEFRFEK